MARRMTLAAFLLPMKLSSTRKIDAAAEPVLGVDLGDHLLGRLDPRLAAEDDDDVAELALERAAARGLDAAHGVLAELDEVVARLRDLGHVGLLGLLVAYPVLAARPFVQESRPGLLRLADEDDVEEPVEPVLDHADPGAADHREDPAGAQLLEDLAHPVALDGHARQADDVERLQGRRSRSPRCSRRSGRPRARRASTRPGPADARTGMFDFLPRMGMPWSSPQNEVWNRGLIKAILAIASSLRGGLSCEGRTRRVMNT